MMFEILAQFFQFKYRKFIKALEVPNKYQTALQMELIKRLQGTYYGEKFKINSIDDWKKIPIVNYQDLQSEIELQQKTKQAILTKEKILFYEKTSGSTGSVKFIPYTKSLRHSFNEMFLIWAYDLIKYGPRLKTHKIYFCISPQFTQGDQIELADDSQYLAPLLRFLLSPYVVSPNLRGIKNVTDFLDRLSQTLLSTPNLEIISIWSPTFLKVILDYIDIHRDQLQPILSKDRQSLLSFDPIPWDKIWPELKLISCWDSSYSVEGADFLRSLFPHTIIQGKGLLATEAPMTIPLIKSGGAVPIITEVFFEFLDQQGNLYQLDQLQSQHEYELIISQKGGLYRYRIGDRIKVTNFYHQTPILEFMGRGNEVSDLVGEKLNIVFVKTAIDQLNLAPQIFRILVPVLKPHPHYLLILDQPSSDPNIALQLDQILTQGYHYHRARQLGQLTPVELLIFPEIRQEIINQKISQGQRWGNLKHPILLTTPILSFT